MVEIIPAILPVDLEDLKEKTSLISGRIPLAHIDVLDTTFLPGEDELPNWEDLSFEVHLMVEHPEEVYEHWVRAGVDRIIVHIENAEFKIILEKKGMLDLEVGLALEFKTPVKDVLPCVLQADFIHLMSERVLGEQGHDFEEGIFEKIRELKSAFPETIISVDGGINLEKAERLIEAGVQRLVIGSAIFNTEDPLQSLEDFINLTE